MPTDIIGILRDILVLGYMFVLRIGVPILITLMIAAWLQKLLRQPTTMPKPTREDLNAGEHCWELKNCIEAQRAQCAAYEHPDLPCWLALQASGMGLKEMCYTCPLFSTHPARGVAAAKS